MGAGGLIAASVVRAAANAPMIVVLIAIPWVMGCALMAWRVTDEPAREAHKFAWWWGGSAGLVLALVSSLFIGRENAIADYALASLSAGRPDWPEGSLAFLGGLMFAATAQMVGYCLVWAGWWAARR
jgi:hypothetical protein